MERLNEENGGDGEEDDYDPFEDLSHLDKVQVEY